MSTKNFTEQHARQDDVVGKLSLAGALCARVNLAKRFADDVERLAVVVYVLRHTVTGAGRDKPCPYISFQSVDARPRQFHLFATHARRGQFHCFINLNVTGAAAKIA